MNKKELVKEIAESVDMSQKVVNEMVTTTIKVITEALAKGEKVALTGFGTFEVRERAARNGINPQTMEKMSIPASKAPAFKAGKTFKDAVR